jgi:hypothetical protein
MKVLRRLTAAGAGAAAAALPALVAAQEGSRALGTPDDVWKVTLLTVLAVGGTFLAATIGYLYRRERRLAWDFQKPDPPGDDEHGGHD